MNRTRERLSKLSFSMPDVTGAGYSPSPGFYAPSQEIVKELEEEEQTNEEGSSVLGPFHEELWMEATDPTSGSVFYVDSAPCPRPHNNGAAIHPSTGSSSLSSSTNSLSHPPLSSTPLPYSSYSTSLPPTPMHDSFYSPAFPPPLSVTPQYSRSVYSISDRGFATLPSSPTHSESIDGFFASDTFDDDVLTEVPSPDLTSSSPAEGWIPKSHSTSSVGRSVRRGWKKMVRRGGRGSKRKWSVSRQRMMPSDSVPNLTEYTHHHEADDVLVSLPPSLTPHGELYGSGGFPLADNTPGGITSIRISLKPHPLISRTHRHWNLDKIGIVPARALKGRKHRSLTSLNFRFKNHYPPDTSSSSSSSNSLVVRGVIPGTPASLTSSLQPGDTILAVNGRSVTLDNANSVVRACSDDELVLIVRKKTHNSSILTSTPAHHHLHTSSQHSSLIRLVSGKQQLSHRHQSIHPHLLLYLTLETKEDDPVDKDIIYCYPSGARGDGGDRGDRGGGEGSVTQLLVQLRGVFLTLSDVMASITAESRSCSTVQVMGQLFHLAHLQYGKEVLLLALPSSLLPPPLLMATAQQVEDTLCLLFGSLKRAFSSQESRESVDHLLSLLFHHLTSPHSHPHSSHLHAHSVSPITALTAVPRGVFSTEAAVRASEALDVLETVSPSHQLTDIAHSPRSLFPRGSFLFHKGHLFQSHLPPGELVDVIMFCQAYRLLEISVQEPRSSIVIWRELHLHMSGPRSCSRDSKLSERVFLLLVGLDHVLVGLVMEGCGLTQETTHTLDPVYVSEAKQLIARLDAQDIFNTSTSRGATTSAMPPVVSLDRVLTVHLSTPHYPHHTHSSPHPRRHSLQQRKQGSDTDEEEDSRHKLGSRAMTLPSLPSRGGGGKRRQQQTHKELGSLLTSLTMRQNYTLTAGVENILLHYLSLEAGQGVWLSPTHNTSSSYGTVHSEMLVCFHRTCSAIRSILLTKTSEESEGSDDECDWGSEEEEVEEKATPPPSFSLPPRGGRCVEHGVLLEAPLKHFATEKQLKNTPPLLYWVVGRAFPESGRELYVCFEDKISQNMVELAFKLLFATSN